MIRTEAAPSAGPAPCGRPSLMKWASVLLLVPAALFWSPWVRPAPPNPDASGSARGQAAIGCAGGAEDRKPDHVVSTVDALRQRLASAGGNGKDDVILVLEGTYSVGSTLEYDARGSLEKIEIIGCGMDKTVFDGLSRNRVFNFLKNGPQPRNDTHVGPYPRLVLEDLTIRNGRCSTSLGCTTNLSGENGGGARIERFETRLTNVKLLDNHDDIFGGGIAGVADLHAINLQAIGNTAGRTGAAIDACGALNFSGSQFANNRGLSQLYASHVINRGICLDGDYSVRDIIIDGTTFDRNTGALYALAGSGIPGLVLIRDSLFTDNTTDLFGTVALRVGHVRVVNSHFLRNVTGAGPGQEKDCTWGFTCKQGGAMFIDNYTAGAGLLEIDGSTFVDNASEGYGGAIDSGGGFNCDNDSPSGNNFTTCDPGSHAEARATLAARISNSIFRNNRARYGGALSIGRVKLASGLQSGNVSVTNTSFIDEGAGSLARSIVVVGGKLDLVNSIVRQTSGASMEQVIQAKDGLRVLNSTIDTRSKALRFRGGARLTNVAFVDDQSIAADGPDALLVEHSRVLASKLVGSPLALSQTLDFPPRFRNATLGDYVLAPSSPLLDAGLPANDLPGDDFSGALRWFGGAPDIGALESGSNHDHSQTRSLSGLPGLPNARFLATALVRPTTSWGARHPDSSPGSAFDSLSDGILWTTVQVPAVPAGAARDFLVLATVASESADRLALAIGEDSDLDGPEESELRCQGGAGAAQQSCEVRVTRPGGSPAALFWVQARNIPVQGEHRTSPDIIVLKAAVLPLAPDGGNLVVTGPGHVPPGDEFPVHLAWSDSDWRPGEERVGHLLVHSTPGVLAYYEPVWLARRARPSSPRILASGVPEDVWLQPGQSHDQLVFDIPPNAGSVTFGTVAGSAGSHPASTGAGSVRLEAHFAGAPEGPAPGKAPSGPPTSVSSVPGSVQSIVLDASILATRHGRWFVRPVNTGPSGASVRVTATLGALTQPAGLRKGSYYDPERGGHGVFLYPAGNQWVLIWYTYLDDGTPTWYYAQGLTPGANGIWTGSLYRAAWNGTGNQLSQIGRVLLTPAGSGALTMAYQFDGRAGSETMQPFLSGCPQVNGANLDASAHWFDPEMPGYGYSVQVHPNYEFHAFFGYDALGMPRFLVAERGGRFDAAEGSLGLQQLHGFSPFSPHRQPTRSTVGSLSRRFGANGVERLGVTATFTNGVAGSWSRDADVVALTERQSCVP